ncbi:MAG: acyl-CoA dehydrogenase family protein [Betaproteobacteria bacterium]|nr:acyl-CoA dehydrogenase family protein [Betaproteobacteria bacterium]
MSSTPYFTETHEQARDAARQFADELVAPYVEAAESEEQLPLELFRKIGQAGYLGIRSPEQYGGSGSDLLTECLVIEQISRACCGIASAMMPQLLVGSIIGRLGTEEQRQRYLPSIISGERICSIAMSEPGAGSDVSAIATAAKRRGDEFVINGTKTFITNGPDAGVVLLLAYTDRSAGNRGLSLFLVERGTPGFSVSRKLPKVGNRASQVCELIFQDCVVRRSALLGGTEGGFRNLLGAVTMSRVTFAARALGVAQSALDAATAYAGSRVAFGQPIGKFQAIQFKLADMATNLEAARLLTYQAAWMSDQGMPIVKHAAMAKLFASERAVEITSEAVQIHGGYGYIMETPVQRYWRDARLLTISEGTSEIQRQTIAKQLELGL